MSLRPICAMCGKPTKPYVLIGREAIGPKCAARAGLTRRKVPKGSRVKFVAPKPGDRQKAQQTLELFPDLE